MLQHVLLRSVALVPFVALGQAVAALAYVVGTEALTASRTLLPEPLGAACLALCAWGSWPHRAQAGAVRSSAWPALRSSS